MTYARGVFHLPFPPSSGTTGVAHVRLDQLKLTSLADQRPRSGWSRPRIVKTSDILYFILYPKEHV
jgi:hypothetical protein